MRSVGDGETTVAAVAAARCGGRVGNGVVSPLVVKTVELLAGLKSILWRCVSPSGYGDDCAGVAWSTMAPPLPPPPTGVVDLRGSVGTAR